ncbi:MAG: carboxylate--amine ligase [Cycloclasticus sp.]|nr:MAG: carboxylate--amine ligase [Cycloclasticus sp.]
MPSQITREFSIKTRAFPPKCQQRVDEWVLSVFDIEDSTYHMKPSGFDSETDELNFQMGCCGQILVNTLLQFANIPVFYLKKEIHYQDDKENSKYIQLRLPVAVIERIPKKAYEVAVRSAFDILQWMISHELTPKHKKQLQTVIEQQCRMPIKKFYKGGKTTLPLLKVAYEQNIPFTHLGSAVYALGWGSKSRQMLISACDSDSAIGSKIAQDKVSTAQILELAGLPGPVHIVVNSKASAIKAAKRLGAPLVVKPTNRDRGEGVMVGIKNIKQLSAAFDGARKYSKGPIIIEKEVPGVCHRLLISNGVLLYAIKRNPISVVGNGKNTVRELIDVLQQFEKDKAPWLNPRAYPDDALAIATMTAQGHSLESKPAIGELVSLRAFQSDAWGGTPEDATADVHPENITAAVRAAKLFGLYNAGIDIITPDITQPWHTNGAIINEVNFTPNMGASEIAKKALPKFLETFIDGDGRIPIHVFVGNELAMKQARKKHAALMKKGIKSSLTSHQITQHLSENEIQMPRNSLVKRCKAMLMDNEVEALIVVIETNECLFDRIPFDKIDSLKIADSGLSLWQDLNNNVPPEGVTAVHAFLKELQE